MGRAQCGPADDAGRWLIPEHRLREVEGELLERVTALDGVRLDMLTDRSAGRPLAIALAFEHWPALIVTAAPLDPLTRFYNRCFWLRRFAALWQLGHGFDAGLEQQANALLEDGPDGVDWDVLAQVDAAAAEELP